MKRKLAASVAVALTLAVVPGANGAPPPPVAASAQSVKALASKLSPRQGKIALPEAKATLDLGTAYDFYGPADARTILVDIWGNPPGEADKVLGLVMLHGKSPLQEAWAAVITYEPTGYVADDDAASADYAQIMKDMQGGEFELNAQRQLQGYPAIHIVGWAEQPNYDKTTHSVIWARDLNFSDTPTHSLNYDVRTLGRYGVLSLNLISTMPHLAEVKAAAHEFAKHASFDPGARYEDFNESTDNVADYGVGGLVAAGVGVAVAKKAGFFAILLKFIKPLLIGIALLFAGLRNRIMGLFGRKTDDLEG